MSAGLCIDCEARPARRDRLRCGACSSKRENRNVDFGARRAQIEARHGCSYAEYRRRSRARSGCVTRGPMAAIRARATAHREALERRRQERLEQRCIARLTPKRRLYTQERREYERNRKHTPQVKARKIVTAAVRHGKLAKPEVCSNCGRPVERRLLHAHHHDYRRPLDVVWLCSGCHRGRCGPGHEHTHTPTHPPPRKVLPAELCAGAGGRSVSLAHRHLFTLPHRAGGAEWATPPEPR